MSIREKIKGLAIGTRPGLRSLVGTLCGACIVTLVALCFSAAQAPSPPSEPNDFTVSFNVTGFPDQPVTGGVLLEGYTDGKARFTLTTPSGGTGVLRDYNKGLSWSWSIDPASGDAIGCTLQIGPTAMQPAFGWLATAVGIGPNRWQAAPASSFFTQGNDLANIFELLGDDRTNGPIALTLGGSPARPTELTDKRHHGLLFDSFVSAPLDPKDFAIPAECPF